MKKRDEFEFNGSRACTTRSRRINNQMDIEPHVYIIRHWKPYQRPYRRINTILWWLRGYSTLDAVWVRVPLEWFNRMIVCGEVS